MNKESFIIRLSAEPIDEYFIQCQEILYKIEGWFSPASHALFSFILKKYTDYGIFDFSDFAEELTGEAANEMAESLGLEGTYKYSNDRNETDIRIFASDTDGDGKYSHFVNDIGCGQYYDPWTGKTGNIADLTLATEGLGQTRNLSYTIKEG